MADKFEFRVVVLWADELRVAAKALNELERINNDESSTKEQIGEAANNAFRASITALRSVDEGAALVVCEGTRGKFVPKVHKGKCIK